MIIEIPWFPKELKANSRLQHRFAKKARSYYKSTCWEIAKDNKPAHKKKYSLSITFHPPCGRRRDLDNCLASIKYGLDGIANAWGVDDSCFQPITIDWGEKKKDGLVVIDVR